MKFDINFALFPDIIYEGIRYSNYDERAHRMIANEKIPFLRAYSVANEHNKLLLIGDGSLGKSTSLRVFEAECLLQGKPCLLYECKSINRNDISEIDAIVANYRNEIFVFDAYDELQATVLDSFNNMLNRMNRQDIKVIVSSRFDPRSVYVTETTSAVLTSVVFSSYHSMKICDFTSEQVDSLVSKAISRSSGYYGLLKNTMILSLHLQLESNNLVANLRDTIKTEAEFIQQYFDQLYFDKISEKVYKKALIDLGEHLHNERIAESDVDEDPKIPEPLQHIFKYIPVVDDTGKERMKLVADQIKYLNYLHGLYLKKKLLSMVKKMDFDALVDEASKLLNIASTSEIAESIYYAGQLLANCPEAVTILKAYNSSASKEKTRYENVLCLFLGYNNDVAEDLEGIFEFYDPSMQSDPYSYVYVCDRIRALKADSIVDVKFTKFGLPQLEQIDINNDVFVTWDNCLIKSGANELYLGCVNGHIPYGVRYIHSHAFVRCPIEKVVIPETTLTIDQYAFSYCDNLNYVELGESLIALYKNAFYACASLETVYIKNNNVQVAIESYDICAFVKTPRLSRAIVPTSRISYIYELEYAKISSLEIFQGYAQGQSYSLSFDCIRPNSRENSRWGSLKQLFIRKDVLNISDDAFMQLGNNLESIIVEDGCERYYSIDNCLISKEEGKLLLGCKNSTIPTVGVGSIKSYAFARCYGLTDIEIPKNIHEIGHNCFQQCLALTTIVFKSKHLRVHNRAFVGCRNIQKVVVDKLSCWMNYEFIYDAHPDGFVEVTSNPLCMAKMLECADVPNGILRLPDGTTAIRSGAFRRFKGLERIFIPRSVTEIGDLAFESCANISEVHIEDLVSWAATRLSSFSSNPLSLGSKLFVSGVEARMVIFPENTTIEKHSFVRTKSIESITLSSGCRVGVEAFKECPNLRRVLVKSSDVLIDKTAFRGCRVALLLDGADNECRKLAEKAYNLEGVDSVVLLNEQEYER